ncbi:MAG: hypothetical protein A2441_01820 [Candidatus Veblenbacteria bacterium RIFOXYC2_FULL_42_11]|uniref:Uncharacterized protein n=1 Tax=Candidatus Veblenbacteria bacterium RIFOXYC2_FULL_42_11 TaxID=1802428 RepID=A0A1G2Q8V7_9BACT|nr:MAG: hypothetical protein A2441_01820 [Candidatus Veblenbacteria bacterium RIFOXYC2_FULL_42_11]HAO81171.1 hypothetical protein [Candidatus Veblenbacteria bacterium]
MLYYKGLLNRNNLLNKQVTSKDGIMKQKKGEISRFLGWCVVGASIGILFLLIGIKPYVKIKKADY